MKNILVINYSQSGQLDQILNNFLVPFKGFEVDRVKIDPKVAYPFPWSSEVFFDAMPETVLEEPIELAPYTLKHKNYDLIIIGYQPWFLSPSQPITALLKDQAFKQVLKGTPVATVIGARNMWLNSQDSIVRGVEEAGGYMVANVPFIDKVQNHISALTILHWMLTGKKTKRWGLLPLPGVSEREITEAGKFGQLLALATEKDNYDGVQKDIIDQGGIYILPSILLIEARAKKLFLIWANLIKRKSTTPKKRAFWVSFFKWYLVTALFVISPPILVINAILNPFMRSKIKRNQQHYLYLGIKNI
jgi:hypothetical protein